MKTSVQIYEKGELSPIIDRDLSLHNYLVRASSRPDLASRILSDLHMMKGVGQVFVPEEDNFLYHFKDELYYHFSRAGRAVLLVAKPAIPMTHNRRKTIRSRFLSLSSDSPHDMVGHFKQLLKISGHQHNHTMSNRMMTGTFNLHMRDLQTPFVEIGNNGTSTLVVPLDLIRSLAKLGVPPRTVLKYAGQTILLAHNSDFTVRFLYVAHLLDDSLFS